MNKSEQFIEGLTPLMDYIREELNTPEVIFDRETHKYLELSAKPNHQTLG